MLPASRVRTFALIGFFVVIPFVFSAVSAQQSGGGSTVQRMHGHLKTLEAVEYAVVRGDVEDAKKSSQALADELSMEGLPTDAQKNLSDLKAAAIAGSKATTLAESSMAVAKMTAACGSCHAALKKTVTLGTPKPAEGAPSLRNRMKEHIWSVQQMAYGLQGPSDKLWKDGASSMKNAKVMKVQLKDEQLTKDVNEAEANFKALADKAADAKDTEARTSAYGQILTSCGHCHSLQGRVFGPGMPK